MDRINEFNKFISVIGFRDVRIVDVNSLIHQLRIGAQPVSIQIFNNDCIAGLDHLFFATLNALKAFNQNKNISKSIELELLLYASGQRQISKAIKRLGVKLDSSNIAILSLASSEEQTRHVEKKILEILDGIRDDKIIGIKSNKKIYCLCKLYNIPYSLLENKELLEKEKILTNLIIEQGALLVTQS